MPELRRYRHLYGDHQRFILLESRDYWLPLNDEFYQPSAATSFVYRPEPLYALPGNDAAASEPSILPFAAWTAEHKRKLLAEAVLNELGQDLSAAIEEERLSEQLALLAKLLQSDS